MVWVMRWNEGNWGQRRGHKGRCKLEEGAVAAVYETVYRVCLKFSMLGT